MPAADPGDDFAFGSEIDLGLFRDAHFGNPCAAPFVPFDLVIVANKRPPVFRELRMERETVHARGLRFGGLQVEQQRGGVGIVVIGEEMHLGAQLDHHKPVKLRCPRQLHGIGKVQLGKCALQPEQRRRLRGAVKFGIHPRHALGHHRARAEQQEETHAETLSETRKVERKKHVAALTFD